MSKLIHTIAMTVLLGCLDVTGGDVVVDPSSSRLWSTITNSSVSIPIPWPAAAKTAKLTAPAVGLFTGVSEDLTKGINSTCQLALPRPQDAESEYVVSLSLEFSNAEGDVLSPKYDASFAVVCDNSYYYGTDVQADKWKTFTRRSTVLPVSSTSSVMTVSQGSVTTTNYIAVPCGWSMLAFTGTGDLTLSLADNDFQELESVVVTRLPAGLIMTIR